MKHLLLISNISIENKLLLEYAMAFCEHYQCKLHVLHVDNYEKPVLVSSAHYYNETDIDYTDFIEDGFGQDVMQKISNVADKEWVKITIGKGNQEEILASFINDNFIDFIIIGNTELNAKTNFINHKNLLLNVVDTPLLVVPELQVFKPFDVFKFLTSQSESDIEDIVHLSSVFSDSQIRVVHKTKKEEDVKGMNWKNYITTKVPDRVSFEDIQESISEYVKKENHAINKACDAFVFTAKKRNFWSRLLDPSTTLSYLAGLEMPSVIYKVEGE